MSSNQKNLQLQALRGVAISGVLLYHFGFQGNNGYLGVDVFFVISGYLVFVKLNGSNPKLSGSSLAKSFILARFFRIYPALITIVVFVSLLSVTFLSPVGEIQTTSKTLFLSLIGLGNYFLATNIGDYFDNYARSSPVLHLWSLSVELQAWGIMLLAFLASRRLTTKVGRLVGFLSAFSLFSFVVFLTEKYLLSSIYSEQMSFYLYSYRAYEFLLGVVAYFLRSRLEKVSIPQFLNSVLLYLIIGLICFTEVDGKNVKYAVLALSIMYISMSRIGHNVGPERGLMRIGDYAYLLYLIHWPVLVIAERIYPDSLLSKISAFIFVSEGNNEGSEFCFCMFEI